MSPAPPLVYVRFVTTRACVGILGELLFFDHCKMPRTAIPMNVPITKRNTNPKKIGKPNDISAPSLRTIIPAFLCQWYTAMNCVWKKLKRRRSQFICDYVVFLMKGRAAMYNCLHSYRRQRGFNPHDTRYPTPPRR